MTIFTVGDSDGERRCDATCHDAREDTCVCICGGRYHGKGQAGALDQAREDFRPLFEHLQEAFGVQPELALS